MSSLLKLSRFAIRNPKKLQNVSLNFVRKEHEKLDSPTHRVNNLEKRFLVWTGKYKKVEEVPDYVSQNVVERARNKMRIKISNYMIGFTAIGCFIMILLGKQAAKRGESLTQQSVWHFKEEPRVEKK